jgi:hypothetical protein
MAGPGHPRRPPTAHSSRERMPLGYRGGLWAARRGVACGSGVRKVVGSYQDAVLHREPTPGGPGSGWRRSRARLLCQLPLWFYVLPRACADGATIYRLRSSSLHSPLNARNPVLQAILPRMPLISLVAIAVALVCPPLCLADSSAVHSPQSTFTIKDPAGASRDNSTADISSKIPSPKELRDKKLLWLDRATIQFRFLRPSSFNTALQLVLRPHFLVHFV